LTIYLTCLFAFVYTQFVTDNQTDQYRIALKQARKSFEEIQCQIEALNIQTSILTEESAKLRRTITALAAMCSEDPQFDDLGITDAVMEFMQSEPWELSTTDVVYGLRNMGFDIFSQQNPAASVHAILSRLAEQGKIQKVKKEKAKKVFWRGPKYDPDALPL
jgi:hypothetical protein